MLAQFVGGPFDGAMLSTEDVSRYAESFTLTTGDRLATFVLLPPIDDWDRVRAGELPGAATGRKVHTYRMHRSATGVAYHFVGDRD
jgi:hypothetical protein